VIILIGSARLSVLVQSPTTPKGPITGWSKPKLMYTTPADELDELIVIHPLYGLSKVLPQWVEARNNDL
jgi:hypothetical protein